MALELHDNDSLNESLTDGDTRELVVQTTKADYFEVLVDGGSTGTTPSSYDVEVQIYSTVEDDYMTREDDAATQAFSPALDKETRGQKVKIVFSANAAATYRVSLEAFKEI